MHAKTITAVLLATATWWVWTKSSEKEVKDVFRGKLWRPENTVGSKLMVSTKFGRCELHKVKVGDKVFDDWLWFDETDAVNVLVQDTEGDFLVFKQSKYGLEKPALAVLGGIIEPHETPLQTAQRELKEELSMTAPTWIDLGTYRVAANRGGGFISCFLAVGAAHVDVHLTDDDLEARSIVKLSTKNLAEKILSHGFGEVKWAATAAMALLHIEYKTTSP
eukprot:TRINITY_DN4972_c0_g1_i1.p1 TRINITY_DN4972_c0_g1~~TRINITY_DN4972_c0_g1_i1.p1  ORF type:complete len:220 (+),score=63.18 TRINITY_DN4972_c0_g1_i1:73-732(+)